MPKAEAEATKVIEVTEVAPPPLALEVIALILLQITIGVGLTIPIEGGR